MIIPHQLEEREQRAFRKFPAPFVQTGGNGAVFDVSASACSTDAIYLLVKY